MTGSQVPSSQDHPLRARALVITASDRSARGERPDRSGPLLVEALLALGLQVDGPRVVPDGEPVRVALQEGVWAGYHLLVTTGGTGVSRTDRTPEMTRSVLDREIPGIAEAIRARGVSAGVPTAMLSRGLAGLAGDTVVVNLPGSTGAVRDGVAVLAPVLGHLLDQIAGGQRRDAGHDDAG
ncbi:MAG: molybdenum cofactor biosynthesis protein B [Actinomycetales bacterium]